MPPRTTPLDHSPPEIWLDIIAYLSKADMRSCRLVSHALNDLSTGMVFSCVTLSFGVYHLERWRFQHSPSGGRDEVQAKTSGLLDWMTSDSRFASSVRSLHVYFFEETVSRTNTLHLTEALQSLHQLRSLVWIRSGSVTSLPSFDINEALRVCCPLLTVLTLP